MSPAEAQIPTLLEAACCLQVSIALWTVGSPFGEFPELLGEFLRCHVTDHFHCNLQMRGDREKAGRGGHVRGHST